MMEEANESVLKAKPKVPLFKKGFRLENGVWIHFDTGGFDDWCVFVVDGDDSYSPTDLDYFTQLKELASKYGTMKVYLSFYTVYKSVEYNDWTENDRVLCYNVCRMVADEYEDDTLLLWIILYMTMLAEERKKDAILGKQIKHLGVYNILFDEYPIFYVTGFVRSDKDKVKGYMRSDSPNGGGKGWRWLRSLMKERDIFEEREIKRP